MEKLQFIINIKAPVNKVYELMLGINNKSTYEQWTAMFNPTSTYEGNWEKGSKMLFVGIDEKGNKGGMVSEIADNVLNQYVSIRHYGLVQANVEITSGPEAEKWATGFENYTFQENNGVTDLVIELIGLNEDLTVYMNDAWPKALAKLKEICEG
ncbi:MAG: SRPBCC domain-containing protein [Chitinophagia bacterium]